jgi:acetylornithine deacetylase
MQDAAGIERHLLAAADGAVEELVELCRALVRIPTQNTPPRGQEKAGQHFVRNWLQAIGVPVQLVDLTRVPGLGEHELFFRGEGYERRDYEDRPNVAARRAGRGGGRTLILSAHMDTMPAGRTSWQRDPFGAQVDGGRIYGRGAYDMKGGLAAQLMAVKLLHSADVELAGDLILESVVDEEHAGANGTLANRLAGFGGDAAVLAEPSGLQLYHAHKGFRIVHLTLRGRGGMSFSGERLANPVEHVGVLIDCFQAFRRQRRRTAPRPPEYAGDPDPVPVYMNKLQAGEFSLAIPMQVPETCTLEVYWQTLPGERREQVEREFFEFLDAWVRDHPALEPFAISHRFSHRWMPGTRIDRDAPVVQVAERAAADAIGSPIAVTGSPYPCDLFVFHHFGIPAVVFGPAGGNGHGSDEYVEIDSLRQVLRMLLLTIVRFCGLA